jgi:hypothetical protein
MILIIKKMNKYSLFSLFIFLFACRSEKNITIGVDKFPVEEMLISSVINVPPLVLAPANIFVTGNYFVITTPRKDTIFDIFSYPDFQYQFSAGVKGGGPDDFATMIDRRCPVSTKKGFNVFFVESKKYREIGIDIYNKRLYTIGEHKYTFEATDDIINGFMPLNDSVVIYLGGFIGKTEYKMLNVYTKEILSFGYYPQWVNSEENKALIYLKGTTAKPDGKKFASFYAYFKRWRIFDNHGNIEADINVNISPLTTDFSDRYTYYGYPFSTDKYIYVCCRNQKFGETQTDNTELQIWNWDGKPVAKYMLDKYIGCFTVDEQQNVLYGANSNEGNEDKIFKYHLP